MIDIDTPVRDRLSALGPEPVATFGQSSRRTAAPVFRKVLVADRGEVAVRVVRALEELGIATVAVYAEPDAAAPHVRRAGEAHCIGSSPATDGRLYGERIVETAARCGADAIHPGYAAWPRARRSRAGAR